MYDTRVDIDEWDIFVHESVNLARFHTTTSITRCCSAAARAGDFGDGASGDRNQSRVHDGLGP